MWRFSQILAENKLKVGECSMKDLTGQIVKWYNTTVGRENSPSGRPALRRGI